MGKSYVGLNSRQVMSEKQNNKKTSSSTFLGLKTGVKEPQKGQWSSKTQRPVGADSSARSVCGGGNEHQVAPIRRVCHYFVPKIFSYNI